MTVVGLSAGTPKPCNYRQVSLDRLEKKATQHLHLAPGSSISETRVRLSALLPEVETRLYIYRQQSQDADMEENFTYENGERAAWDEFQNTLTRDRRTKRVYRFGAQWELDRLLFAGEELDFQKQRRSLIRRRTRLKDRLAKLYFSRQRRCSQLEARHRRGRPIEPAKIESIRLLSAKIENLTGINQTQKSRREE